MEKNWKYKYVKILIRDLVIVIEMVKFNIFHTRMGMGMSEYIVCDENDHELVVLVERNINIVISRIKSIYELEDISFNIYDNRVYIPDIPNIMRP